MFYYEDHYACMILTFILLPARRAVLSPEMLSTRDICVGAATGGCSEQGGSPTLIQRRLRAFGLARRRAHGEWARMRRPAQSPSAARGPRHKKTPSAPSGDTSGLGFVECRRVGCLPVRRAPSRRQISSILNKDCWSYTLLAVLLSPYPRRP